MRRIAADPGGREAWMSVSPAIRQQNTVHEVDPWPVRRWPHNFRARAAQIHDQQLRGLLESTGLIRRSPDHPRPHDGRDAQNNNVSLLRNSGSIQL